MTGNINQFCVTSDEKCLGFLCPDFRNGYCEGIIKSIFDKQGNFIASVRPLTFEDDSYEGVLMRTLEELHNNGYLTKQEVVDNLKEKYGIEISEGTLKYYATERLVDRGFKRRLPGIKGTISLYKDNTPDRIYFIKYLQDVYRFTLQKLAEYSKLLLIENPEKLNHYKNYKIEVVKDENGKEFIRLGEGKLFNDFADFQEFSILRAMFEIGRMSYDRNKALPYDSTVSIAKDEDNQDNIVVKLGGGINKEVVFDINGVNINK